MSVAINWDNSLSLINANVIKNNLNKSNKQVHHLNNSRLTLLTVVMQVGNIRLTNLKLQQETDILMNLLSHSLRKSEEPNKILQLKTFKI